jgi:hypothetical protein
MKDRRSLAKKAGISWGGPANEFLRNWFFQFLKTEAKTALFGSIEFL